jgi:transposase InsO family protein
VAAYFVLGTTEGWLYLAVILDPHSRRVVGWAVSDRMKKYLAIRALDMAVRFRNPPKAASSILIAAANIALMIIKRSCRPTACGHR